MASVASGFGRVTFEQFPEEPWFSRLTKLPSAARADRQAFPERHKSLLPGPPPLAKSVSKEAIMCPISCNYKWPRAPLL
ncbi:hypothetical protein M9X92_003840 [Pyricularia oryzae]|nr:hypothetical protein M9X92_003840 [Pyricularia oryzae]